MKSAKMSGAFAFVLLCNMSSVEACEFDASAAEFKGSPVEQARCLLPTFTGILGLRSPIGLRDTLGQPLEGLIGKPFGLDRKKFATKLQDAGLKDAAASIDEPVSKTIDQIPAKYFLIHDTSTPVEGSIFPSSDSKSMRRLGTKWKDGTWRAHAWVNRLGEARITVDYSRRLPNTAIKFEQEHRRLKGLFLHTEVTQPRVLVPVFKHGKLLRDKKGKPRLTDKIIPVPAFLPEQYKMLALLYAYASAKAGHWLIPAYHIALDYGKSDGHDDPQHFDLAQFSSSLRDLTSQLSAEIR